MTRGDVFSSSGPVTAGSPRVGCRGGVLGDGAVAFGAERGVAGACFLRCLGGIVQIPSDGGGMRQKCLRESRTEGRHRSSRALDEATKGNHFKTLCPRYLHQGHVARRLESDDLRSLRRDLQLWTIVTLAFDFDTLLQLHLSASITVRTAGPSYYFTSSISPNYLFKDGGTSIHRGSGLRQLRHRPCHQSHEQHFAQSVLLHLRVLRNQADIY